MQFQVYAEIKPWKKPLHALRALFARTYLKLLPGVQVVGITGSVGKTLTQNAVCSVLSQKYNVICGDENLDPTFRIPQTLLKARPWHNYIVLEYGVEHPGDMDYYLSIAKPKFAIVTNIAPTHTKYFKSEEGVYQEKVKLVEALPPTGVAFLNKNDEMVSKMELKTKAGIFNFGAETSQIKTSHFKQNLKGASFRLHYKGNQAVVNWKIIGKHQLLSALAASSLGIVCGLTIKQIAEGLSQTSQPDHRLAVVKFGNTSIIDDTYNSSPLAAKQSLKTLSDLGNKYKKIAVLAQMKDLGDLSIEKHKNLGKFISKENIGLLVTVGKTAKIISDTAVASGFKGKAFNCSTVNQALNLVKPESDNSLILVKGSRHAHLERIVLGLQNNPTDISCYQCGNLK